MRYIAELELEIANRELFAPQNLLKRLFGAEREATGTEQVLLQSLAVVERFIAGYRHAGFDDVVTLAIDDRVIYHDDRSEADDVAAMMAALEKVEERLDPDFRKIRMVMERRGDGLHCVSSALVRGKVTGGRWEVTVTTSARPLDMIPRAGEGAESFRARLTELFERDPGVLVTLQSRFKALNQALADQLVDSTGALDPTNDRLELQLERPREEGGRSALGVKLVPKGAAELELDDDGLWFDPWAALYSRGGEISESLNDLVLYVLGRSSTPALPPETVLIDGHGTTAMPESGEALEDQLQSFNALLAARAEAADPLFSDSPPAPQDRPAPQAPPASGASHLPGLEEASESEPSVHSMSEKLAEIEPLDADTLGREALIGILGLSSSLPSSEAAASGASFEAPEDE